MCHYSKLPKENLLPQPFKSNPIWSHLGGRHSSVVSSEPTILQQWVQIPRTPSHFSICIIEIVMRKGRKRGWDSPIFNPIWSHYTHIPTYAVTNDIFSLAVGWVTLPDGTLIRKASSWASWSATSSSDDEFDNSHLVSSMRGIHSLYFTASVLKDLFYGLYFENLYSTAAILKPQFYNRNGLFLQPLFCILGFKTSILRPLFTGSILQFLVYNLFGF